MADHPLGIADLRLDAAAEAVGFDVSRADHWYWCRRHQRAEHVNDRSLQHEMDDGTGALTLCVRIGPFMSEAEANILRREHPEFPEGDKPLGMEIER